MKPELTFNRTTSPSCATASLFLLVASMLSAQRPEDQPPPPTAPVYAEFKFDFGPGQVHVRT